MLDALSAHLVLFASDDAWPDANPPSPSTRHGADADGEARRVDDIVAHIQSSDEHVARQAFEQLFRTRYAELCAFAMHYVQTMAIAEEVVSDVFFRLWASRGTWAPHESVVGYLYGAVRYASLNTLRGSVAERRRYDLLGADESMGEHTPSEVVDALDAIESADDLRLMVWRAVRSLPEPQQIVLTLRWQRGLSWDDVAEAMGATTAAAKMHQSRALKTLRARLPRYLR